MAVRALISIGIALAAVWGLFMAVLVLIRPKGMSVGEAKRVVPDTVRLLRSMARDPSLPRGARRRLAVLLLYLALPIDVVPDFIPVVGYIDDVILVAVVLRSVVRRAGPAVVDAHWSGTDEGLGLVKRLCGLTGPVVEPHDHARLLRHGFILEWVTLGWNLIGVAVLAITAVAARSVALAGFGLDSLIEIAASTVVLWELSGVGEERRQRALRLIGVAFAGLAIYLAIQSTVILAIGYHPDPSRAGIAWTAVTAALMFTLAAGKARTGTALNNPVLQTEGRVTLIDGILAAAVLLGLVLNAAAGWWWADPLAAYVLVYYGTREARAALTSH